MMYIVNLKATTKIKKQKVITTNQKREETVKRNNRIWSIKTGKHGTKNR